MDKVSYALGMGIGRQLMDMGAKDLNIDDFAKAIKDTLSGNVSMTDEEAQVYVQNFFMEQEKKQRAATAEKYETIKKTGEDYLAENAKKEGVIVTESGLQYMLLKEGTGKSPKAKDKVVCHYEGRLIDGTIFDSSIQRGEPATFGLNQVISGWTEGLQYMKEGGKTRFFIPYQLGYGDHGAGGTILPFSALVFDVELIEVK